MALKIASPMRLVQGRRTATGPLDSRWLDQLKDEVTLFFQTASLARRKDHRVRFLDLLPEPLQNVPGDEVYAFDLDGRIAYVLTRTARLELGLYDQHGQHLGTQLVERPLVATR
ncbi:MAG: hypothetical protein IT384_14740 [Deltaproteobacteria bacterium]|nr:hypothetical protein [Deltaproteobacteria bacterium]